MRNRESIIFTQEELSTEEWKDIIGYDYEYQISDLGRLKRVTSFHKNKENTITLGSFDSDGYLRIGLVKDGKSIGKKLHRLVGEYFIEGYCEELTINHIDFVKNNNRKWIVKYLKNIFYKDVELSTNEKEILEKLLQNKILHAIYQARLSLLNLSENKAKNLFLQVGDIAILYYK